LHRLTRAQVRDIEQRLLAMVEQGLQGATGRPAQSR
jgi:hypothetical protein